MIRSHPTTTPVEMLPGLVRRTLVSGPTMMLVEFTFQADVEVPQHAHPHEQVGYIVSGRLRMTIAGESFELTPGDTYCAPANVPHGALALEPSIVVDTFNPPREDYKS